MKTRSLCEDGEIQKARKGMSLGDRSCPAYVRSKFQSFATHTHTDRQTDRDERETTIKYINTRSNKKIKQKFQVQD